MAQVPFWGSEQTVGDEREGREDNRRCGRATHPRGVWRRTRPLLEERRRFRRGGGRGASEGLSLGGSSG